MCVANVSKFNKYFIHIIVYLYTAVSYLYVILTDMKFPYFLQSVHLLIGQVHMVFCPQKLLYFPNPPLQAGLGDTGFVLSSHWVGVLAYKKKIHYRNCGMEESRKRMSTENWSTCGMRQKDVCGFDTSWLILMETWMNIVVATFQCWVPVVIWQKYLYSCLGISCQEIWSYSSYTVQLLCQCFPTASNWRLAFSWFIA